MIHLDTKNSKIIVKDEKRNLYLRSVPLYRGMTRWNSFKKQAIRFNDMSEACAAVESIRDKDLDIIYEMVDEKEDEDKEVKDDKRFMTTIYMVGASSIVHWGGKDALEILDRAVLMAKNTKSELMSVVVEEKGSVST